MVQCLCEQALKMVPNLSSAPTTKQAVNQLVDLNSHMFDPTAEKGLTVDLKSGDPVFHYGQRITAIKLPRNTIWLLHKCG